MKAINRERLRGILAYAVGPVLGILSGPILARSLGLEGRGEFATAMQPLAVFGAIATFGIPAAVTYFGSQSPQNRTAMYRRGLILALPTALAVWIAMLFYSGTVAEAQGMSRSVLMAAWSFVLLSAVIQLRRAFWQSAADWKRLDRERLYFALFRFAAVVGVAVLGFTASSYFVFASLGAFVIAASLLWIPRASSTDPASSIPELEKPASTPQFAKYAALASMSTIMIVANSRLDQVLMPAQTTSAEMGHYAIAVTVAEVPIVLGTLAARNAFQQSSSGQAPRAVLRHARFYILAGIGLAIGLAITSPILVPWVFGGDFRASVGAVAVLCASTCAAILCLVMTAVINGVGRPGVASLVPVSSVCVMLVSFVAMWGSIGALEAAVIAAVSQTVGLVVGCVALRKMRHPVDTPVGVA